MGLEIFKGLRDAKVFERGVFLSEGGYRLRVLKCLLKHTRKSGDAYIVEFEVVKSSNEKHPVGSKATWFQKMTDPDVAFGALKLFMYAMLGFEYPKDKDLLVAEIDPKLEELMAETCVEIDGRKVREHGTLDGKLIDVTVALKDTTAGKKFSNHVWQTVRDAA